MIEIPTNISLEFSKTYPIINLLQRVFSFEGFENFIILKSRETCDNGKFNPPGLTQKIYRLPLSHRQTLYLIPLPASCLASLFPISLSRSFVTSQSGHITTLWLLPIPWRWEPASAQGSLWFDPPLILSPDVCPVVSYSQPELNYGKLQFLKRTLLSVLPEPLHI